MTCIRPSIRATLARGWHRSSGSTRDFRHSCAICRLCVLRTITRRAYTLTDYANAQLLEGLRQRDPKSVERSEAAGAVTLAGFVAVRERTDMRFWAENKTSLQAAKVALKALNEVLEEACGRDAPGLGAIGDAIDDILSLTSAALSSRRPGPFSLLRRATSEPASSDIRPPMSIEEPPPPPPSPHAAHSREDAYAQLAEPRGGVAPAGAAQPGAVSDPLCC